MRDPANNWRRTPFSQPRARGPGSSKEAWIAYAERLVKANQSYQTLLGEQSAVIRLLRAEMVMLKRQIAERRPPGGRAPLNEGLVDRIEGEIAEGGTDRSIARRYGISHMSVFRARQRMKRRQEAAQAR